MTEPPETEAPESDAEMEMRAFALLQAPPRERPCRNCEGEVHVGAAHLGLVDHLLVVAVISMAGWSAIGLFRHVRLFGLVAGGFFATLIAAGVIERRFFLEEHRCQRCGERRLARKEWAPRRLGGGSLRLHMLFFLFLGIALVMLLGRVLSAS